MVRQMNKFKVLFLTNQTSPYMVNFFNELGKFVDLKVLFEQKKSDVESWNSYSFDNFEGIILNGFKISNYGSLAPSIIIYLSKRNYNFIVVSNPTSPTGIIAILFMKLFSIKYIIESEGGYPGKSFNLKEVIKRIILKNASYYLSGNATGDDYFIKYGASKEKIFRYSFSSIYQMNILPKLLTKSEKIKIREKYNLKGKLLVIAIGRYSVEKNYKWLIKEWLKMPKNCSLYIIGEGPEKKSLQSEIRENKLNNVFLLDYMKHDELLNFITPFDLFVHPTKSDVWGLVINEAMSKGLPIVTTKYCLSASELIVNGENGYISELDDSFIQKVINLLDNEDLMNKMARNNIDKIRFFTFETMAYDHLKLFDKFWDFEKVK